MIWIYVPAWFHCVQSPSILEGPRILQGLVTSMLEGSETIPFGTEKKRTAKRVKEMSELGVMQASIDQNRYFAHCEWVLLSMLTDPERKDLREKAKKTILNIREWEKEQEAARLEEAKQQEEQKKARLEAAKQ